MARSKVAAVCVLLLVGVVHVLGVMSYLVREGRLSIVPIYDDVGYLLDGLNRLAVLDRAGIAACIADFYTHAAHAPITSLTSVLGLFFSGGAIWGPYALSAAWLVLILAIGMVALRQFRLGTRVGILVAALAAPMFGTVLTEFRPDPVWGLLAGFALILCASTDLGRLGRRRLLMLGLLFGLAIVSKPSASPATTVVLFTGLTAQICITSLLRRTWSARPIAKVFLFVGLGAACIVGPYLLSNGAGILAYIQAVMGGGSMWRIPGTAWDHATYYLNRGVGTLMLGWMWYLAIPCLAVCLALLWRAKDWLALSGLAGLLASVATAYIIVTVSAVKSLMIGSLLYGTIVASVVWVLAHIADRIALRETVVIALGLLLFATQWVPRVGMIHRSDPSMAAIDKASRDALPAFVEALRENPQGRTVLVTVPGPVYAGTLDFLARQHGMSRHFVAAYTWETWEQFTQALASADVVVLSEPGMVGQSLAYTFPSVKFQQPLLELLRGGQEFTGRPIYTDAQRRSVWLFVRRKAA